jgi:hypothetical protein
MMYRDSTTMMELTVPHKANSGILKVRSDKQAWFRADSEKNQRGPKTALQSI